MGKKTMTPEEWEKLSNSEQFRTIYDQVHDNHHNTNKQIDDILLLVEKYYNHLEKLQKRTLDLENINTSLIKEIDYLKKLCVNPSNEIIVGGIPRSVTSSLQQITRKIFEYLKIDNLYDDVLDVRMLNSKNKQDEGDTFSYVIVLKSPAICNFILKTKRAHGDIKGSDLFPDTTNKEINFYEMLPQSSYNLLLSVKSVAKMLNYKFVWARGGTILIRKEESSAIIPIVTESDLRKLK